jgi:tryptophan synthase alpha chain
VQTIAEHAGCEAEALAPVVSELRQALE